MQNFGKVWVNCVDLNQDETSERNEILFHFISFVRNNYDWFADFREGS